jgi:hypothetical protein
MNETMDTNKLPKACQHCYGRIVKVNDEWVDIALASSFCISGEPRITHKPMPSVWGKVEEES